MADPIAIPLHEDDRLSDPPLLDLFRDDAAMNSYVATLVPSDNISGAPTLVVTVPKQSVEGRRIAILLSRVEGLCGKPLLLVSHLGGGDYTLRFLDQTSVTLSSMDNGSAVEVFDRLKQIAVDAEMAHRIEQNHAREWRPAV